MEELIGKQGDKRLSKIGMEQMLVSMGHQSCGAVALWNFPTWLRNLIAHDIDGEDRPDPVDMATMEGNMYSAVPFASMLLYFYMIDLF
jgi:hypothetical protein